MVLFSVVRAPANRGGLLLEMNARGPVAYSHRGIVSATLCHAEVDRIAAATLFEPVAVFDFRPRAIEPEMVRPLNLNKIGKSGENRLAELVGAGDANNVLTEPGTRVSRDGHHNRGDRERLAFCKGGKKSAKISFAVFACGLHGFLCSISEHQYSAP